jgi:glucuronokinase
MTEMIKKITCPRIGFLGNPSDGFGGKTISFTFKNFQAEVVLWPSEELKFLSNLEDQDEFPSIADLYKNTQSQGYYGGIRLIKAAISVFYRYCQKNKIKLEKKNFTIAYRSNIPQQRGLAGSSAIIISTLNALIDFYGLKKIESAILANLALEAEVKELGIAAGLQDRVVQSFNQPVFMDFSPPAFEKNNGLYGEYKTFSANLFPPMAVVMAPSMSESGKVHSDVRNRFDSGDPEVITAMAEFASFAEAGFSALKSKDLKEINRLVNANFNLRRKIYGDKVVGLENIKMIELIRTLGGAAKFTGSGGAALLVAPEGKIKKICQKLIQNGYQAERIIL